ncbi:MAG: beta-ketoacyl-ACP synthase [Sandaracinaceae bacterium]|nr:MAG: beta-ketoacyl-ACP synthase [Sandaracinaceae bacterium]HBQ11903.1 beta-ketoacyl-ACP synthase [Myxococcales bacterium]
MTRPLTRRKVVVTGMGVVCPIGHSVDALIGALREGKSGIRYMPEWEQIAELKGRLGGNVEGLDLKKRYPRKKRRTMGRVALLATYASEQAVEQAGLTEETLTGGRLGVAYGTTSPSNQAMEDFCGPLFNHRTMRGLDSTAYLKFMTHTAAANLTQFFGVQGRVIPTNSACTSAAQAIGYGYEAISTGKQDVMLCGGAEEQHYATAVTFDLLMATSVRFNDRPEESPRPFDARRDGLVVAEGAATVVIEAEEHAKARGATILAELVGFGTNCDGAHMTANSRKGMAGAIRLALEDAGLTPGDVDYVNAHATATDVGDIEESHATFDVFERPIAVSSLKGHMGHTLGACGAIDAIACVRMMQDGFLAPTLHLEEVDPRCAPLGYVREVTKASPRTVMSNNFAFGGVNTSLIFRRPEE